MRAISRVTSETLVATSILVAIMTFSIGYFHRTAANRNELTFNLMLQIIASEGPVHDANLKFAKWIRNGKYFKDDDVSAEEDEVIIRLIDFYDVVSDASLRGIVDKDMIVLHLGGRMRSAYKVIAEYIKARRVKIGRPGLYRPFVKFVTEYVEKKEV
jgi:hypothetical protein